MQTLLQPASSACAGLRSGKYRVINPHEVGHDAAYVAHLITVNAATLTVTDDLDASHTPIAITPDATSACQFTLPGDFGTATLLVSASGMAILHAPNALAQTQVSLILPEQTIPVADLAGLWNFMVYDHSNGTSFVPGSGTATFDAAGNFTDGTDCTGLSTCVPNPPPYEPFVANAAGGFDHGTHRRMFAFKSANGGVSLFQIDTLNGSFVVATKQAALSLPVLGNESRFWDFQVGSNGAATPVTHGVVTVTSVDAASQSFTRTRSTDGRVDGFTLNQPRNGLRYRAAGSSPTSSGGTVNFAATIVMPLPGTGMNVNISTAANQNFFGVTVVKP